MDTLLQLLTIPAASGYFYNDVLALVSFLGSLILFLDSFPHSPFKRWIGLAEWSSAPLVFGLFFQVSLLAIGFPSEEGPIGFLVPMPLGMVNGLFGLSLLLMAGRGWIRRTRSLL